MEVINCKKCNRLFQYIGGRMICPVCHEEEEQEFKLLKEYLYEHPKATMVEVSQATGVSVTAIRHYLREGRLIITNDSPIGIECEKCGIEIKTGRFCERCAYELEMGMRMATNELLEKNKNPYANTTKSKMHYLRRTKDDYK
ncbi:MAG TPA: winged helix-turn-helix transcriptional regulator [Defluviitaleaceae bacterium]|nr:winged helix-turn-helix transcriptional regulator [Candidatus Epulonipiscium sp.]HOQ16714.1 winged helix-turn-helix transcriptional regulator [Defluviitaleaceae bacterium]HPT75757.1 winged helix-turn-helix transcriptional regulator [Defluviitaleaceae bacterium]HQD50659.1 winged helix-turn-helix transcriptional regulator [Defluviitaleaceae bacterium]